MREGGGNLLSTDTRTNERYARVLANSRRDQGKEMSEVFDMHKRQMQAMEEERKYRVQCDNYRLATGLVHIPITLMAAQMRGMIEAMIWGIKQAAIRSGKGRE